ncbi:acyltransferase family protein [Porphyromonas sp.]
MLRIVAMLFIMALHLNRENVGFPSESVFVERPICAFLWSWLRTINLTGVDIFVLISGYFAIRPRVNSVASLFFQGLFYSVGMYFVWVLTNQASFSIVEVLMHLRPMIVYWFFGCYIWLVMLMPILNLYIEKVNQRAFGTFLLVYYFFVCAMEWLGHMSVELSHGFSVLSFVGLYLLGRYVRVYGGRWCELAPRYDLLIFLGATLLSALIAFVCNGGIGRALVSGDSALVQLSAYTSPLCIASALSLVLFFSKLKMGSIRWINWFAASSFSVYLLHEEYITRDHYMMVLPYISRHYSGITWGLVVVSFLLVLYVAVTLLDQLRQLLWKKVFSPLVVRLEEYVLRRIKL